MNLSLWFLKTSYFTNHLTELWGKLRIYWDFFAGSLGRTTANTNEVCHQSDTITNHWVFNILNSTSFNIILICCWISGWLVSRFPHRHSVCISCLPPHYSNFTSAVIPHHMWQSITNFFKMQYLHYTHKKSKAKQSRYRPGVAQRVPGS